MSSSDESDDDSEQDGSSSGSEFKLSGSDSVDTDSPTEDSNASSDFNPFDTDTDSDAGSLGVSLWGKWRQGYNIQQFFVFVNTGKRLKNSDCEDSILLKYFWTYLLFQRRWSRCCEHQFEYVMKLFNHFSLVLSSLH